MKRGAAITLAFLLVALLYWPIAPSIAPLRNAVPEQYPRELIAAVQEERAEVHAIRLLNDRGPWRGLMRQLALWLQTTRARLFAGDDKIAAFLIENAFYLQSRPGVAYWAETCLGKTVEELQQDEIAQAVRLLRIPQGKCLTP